MPVMVGRMTSRLAMAKRRMLHARETLPAYANVIHCYGVL
jgi:hypothetical protein